MKEELQRKEQIKEADRKRQEKADDKEAKRRIMAQIAADKEERRRKAEEAKALREGRAPEATASESTASAPAPAAKKSGDDKPAAAQARLRLQTATGNIMKTLPAETTLMEVALMVKEETGIEVTKLSTTFPRKTFSGPTDMGQTLKEVGWTPSAAVVVE